MNSKLALTAIVMVAAILAFGTISPAMAAKNKVDLCHYSAEEIVVDDLGVPTGEVIPEHWKIINISDNGNAVAAHENNHEQDNGVDPVQSDFQITDEDPVAEAANQSACDALILAFAPPVEETEV